jgi:hypothetical protein
VRDSNSFPGAFGLALKVSSSMTPAVPAKGETKVNENQNWVRLLHSLNEQHVKKLFMTGKEAK